MKNEERIIELLSGYLQKTDRTLGRMENHDQLFEKQLERIDLAYQTLIKHPEQIEDLHQETKAMRIQQDVLLKEILSHSKRIQNLEDNR